MKQFGIRKEKLDKRSVVVAIIYNEKNKSFVLRRDNDDGYIQFIRGGIEEKENPIEAVRREVKEESGISNLKSIKKLGDNYIVFEFEREMRCFPFLVTISDFYEGERFLEEDEYSDYTLVQRAWLDNLKNENVASHTLFALNLAKQSLESE